MQIKALAPLRSSDRRKTADELIADLNLKPATNDDANEDEKAAAVAENTALRNSLLPDNTLSARFTTTAGPDLKPVSGTLYAGSHIGEEQRLLWTRIDDRMFPTGMWSYLHVRPEMADTPFQCIHYGAIRQFSLSSIRPATSFQRSSQALT